jgi:hypothetical protein
MAVLFISSSCRDHDEVAALRRALSTALAGWEVEDDLARAEAWRDTATSIIEFATAFAFVSSVHSCESANCGWELDHARRAGTPVINVQLAAELPHQLRGVLQEVPTVLASGRDAADVAEDVTRLLARLIPLPTHPTAG